jgi:hypothetical protein
MRMLVALALLPGCLLSGKEVGSGDDTTSDANNNTGDGGGPNCTADFSEPNDTRQMATQTGVSDSTMPSTTVAPLSICVTSDRDFFQLNITNVSGSVDVTAFSQKAPGVDFSIQNAGGSVLANGMVSGSDPTLVHACASDLPSGTYFIEAQGAVVNSYSLDINLVPTCM